MPLETPPSAADIQKTVFEGLSPSWMDEEPEELGALFGAFSAVFELAIAAGQTLHNRTFIETADADHLDEHGRERGVLRIDGEIDFDYSLRIRQVPDRVTVNAILAAVDAELLVGTATIVEDPVDDPSFVRPTGTTLLSLGVVGVGNVLDTERFFTINIALQQLQNQNTAFTATTGQIDKSFTFTWEDQVTASPPPTPPGAYTADSTVPAASAVYRRVVDAIDANRAAGVGFQVLVS